MCRVEWHIVYSIEQCTKWSFTRYILYSTVYSKKWYEVYNIKYIVLYKVAFAVYDVQHKVQREDLKVQILLHNVQSGAVCSI